MNSPARLDPSDFANGDSLYTRDGDLIASPHEDLNAERAQQLIRSLRRRWWYYLLITIVAAGAGYQLSTEHGTYKYTAQAQVRSKNLPFPPGKTYYSPPSITDFTQYLKHPAVLNSAFTGLGEVASPDAMSKIMEDTYDAKTKVVTVKVTQPTAAEAAAMVNQIVSAAIQKSTDERIESLNASLIYFNSLVGATEAEAASRRQAKVDRLQALRTRFARDRGADLEFEELTALVRQQRLRVADLELELTDANRLRDVLTADARALVTQVRDDVVAQLQDQMQIASGQFAAGSAKSQELGQKQEQLTTLASQKVSTPADLTKFLRAVAQLIGAESPVRPEHAAALERLNADVYALKNRLVLLPKKIEDAKQTLTRLSDQRAAVETGADLDLENVPEILELTAQIARAERSVEEMTQAIAWVKNMLTLDAAAYEQLGIATPQTTTPSGNHKKLFVAVFGALGLLLGAPMLIFDVSRSTKTPSEILGREFGLQTISTRAFDGGITGAVSLAPDDPELRLLALRIQRSAQQARGSVVLFSSLCDNLSTAELTTTIASCLAARQEKVLIIDLEPIETHRGGTSAPALVDSPVELQLDRCDEKVDSQEHSQTNGWNHTNGNGHGYDAGVAVKPFSGRSKLGLARALAGGTSSPEDVLIEHGSDGIDRLRLGEGELPVEAFASPLMTQLFDHLRNQYSMVLLSGPAAKHLADVQMLATRCDGTLFVAPTKGRLAPAARRTILDLIENRVPIMGIAEVPA